MRANTARRGRGTRLFAAGLAALFAIAPATAEIEGDNVTNNELATGVYSLKIEQGTRPTISVWPDGDSYKTVTGHENAMFGLDVRGVCRGLWKVKELSVWVNDQTKASAHAYFDHHVKVWSKTVGTNYSTTKAQAAVFIGGELPASAKKRYVKACNDMVDKRVEGGMSRAQAMSKPATLTGADYDPPLAGVVYMRCFGDPSGQATGETHAWRDLDVEVKCRGSRGGTPAVPGGGTSLSASSVITLVKAEVTPDDYAGKCPADMFVTGQIDTTKGGTKLSYRWRHSGQQALGPVKQTTTGGSGSAHVSTSFKVKRPPKPNGGGNGQMKLANPNPEQTGWVELWVLPEGQTDWSKAKKSNRSDWKVKCDPKPKRAKPKTPKPRGPKAVLKPQTRGKKPNLMSTSGLRLNTKTAPWGGLLKVQADPAQKKNGRCGFRMRYEVTNNGQAAASGYASRLANGAAQIHKASNLTTQAGAKTVVSGTVYLPDGQHTLVAKLDSQKAVDETNEGDNLYRIRVEVSGCKRPPRARPQ